MVVLGHPVFEAELLRSSRDRVTSVVLIEALMPQVACAEHVRVFLYFLLIFYLYIPAIV